VDQGQAAGTANDGVCRSLNVLLGASLGATGEAADGVLTFRPRLGRGSGHGRVRGRCDVVRAARAESSDGWHLAGAILVMLGGIAWLACCTAAFRRLSPGIV